MNVTFMVSHHCALVLLAVFGGDMNEACVISLYINVFLKKKRKERKGSTSAFFVPKRSPKLSAPHLP